MVPLAQSVESVTNGQHRLHGSRKTLCHMRVVNIRGLESLNHVANASVYFDEVCTGGFQAFRIELHVSLVPPSNFGMTFGQP